jgi:hypothetical protein
MPGFTSVIRSKALTVVGAFGICALVTPAAASPDTERPNVLFILVDDLNDWVGYLGSYGDKVHAPNIDRLAERGIADGVCGQDTLDEEALVVGFEVDAVIF